MSDRYPHVFATPTHCTHCGSRPDDDDAPGECPVRLRQALHEAQAVIAEADALIGLKAGDTCDPRAASAWAARVPHVAAHKARQEGGK